MAQTKHNHGGKRLGAGRPITEGEKLEKVTIRLPLSRVNAACAKTGQSMSEFVRRAIIAALDKMKL